MVLAWMISAVPCAKAQGDTSKIYEDLERFSAKHKFTRWVHSNIFVGPEREEPPPAPGTPKRRLNPYAAYKGRIVRNVDVTVLDPFGNSVEDTVQGPTRWLQGAGNSLHRRSRHYMVRELMLVKKHEAFDPLEALESERLIRASPIANDARITVFPVRGGRDSVDIHVVVLDKWSIDGRIVIGTTVASVTGRDRNLLGLGQELEQSITYGTQMDRPALEGRHRVYNIRGTYVSSLLEYATNSAYDRFGFSFDRPFYSPLAKWAGALSLFRTWNRIPVRDDQGVLLRTDHVEPVDFDTWLGRSFRLADVPTDPGRSSAIIVAMRYVQTRYLDRPEVISGIIPNERNSSILLASLGLSVRQYYRERYLYRFGATEDVPEGLLIEATGGIRERESEPKLLYSGVQVSRGRHYPKFGYATVQIGYGTFWRNDDQQDATFRGGFRYFSDLVRVQRWFVRQFISGTVITGTHRTGSQRLDLNGDQLFGFNSASVRGTHKELLTFETVAYAPYHLLGFRFAPVLLVGFGTIGEEGEALFSGRIHPALGLGVLVRNENLLVKTFEVSISFYPYLPDQEGPAFKSGSFTNFALRVDDFAVGPPSIIGF